jgi:hypothetical protein
LEGIVEGLSIDKTAHETIVEADEEETETGQKRDGVEKGIALEADELHGGGGMKGRASNLTVPFALSWYFGQTDTRTTSASMSCFCGNGRK